ncbi:MAG: type IV toxin-antitoxin system AbiEi family antitoxin domain-containing protein [Solirubrobacteraceae bacterium]
MLGDNSDIGRETSQGVDAAIAALAVSQHGNVTRRALIELGVSDDAIAHRIRRGRLHRVHRGVYAVGRPPSSALERAAAAVLAGGPGAALSHGSALTLWGIWKRWEAPLEVVVERDRRPRRIKVHRSRTLARQDLSRHLDIPVTSLARTLLDCSPRLSDRSLARAVNNALLSRWLTRSELAEVLRRHPRCPATERLAPFAITSDSPTRSELEDVFLSFCGQFELPRPRVNTLVMGREVDAYFERERLIVELDGYEYHSNRHAFERDRDRDADAILNGVATVRITWERMTEAPAREAGRLRQILRSRRAAAA